MTFKPDRDLRMDKSDSNLLRKKPLNQEAGLCSGKTKDETKEEKRRYDFLGPDELTATKNPKRFDLLFPSTRKYTEEAGIVGEDAEKDTLSWNVLMNCLRFLKVQERMRPLVMTSHEDKIPMRKEEKREERGGERKEGIHSVCRWMRGCTMHIPHQNGARSHMKKSKTWPSQHPQRSLSFSISLALFP